LFLEALPLLALASHQTHIVTWINGAPLTGNLIPMLDLKTVLFSYTFSNLICAIVLFSLWKQNRSRYPGLGFWLTNFLCNFVGLILLILRGVISDFISILVGNTILMGGTYSLYMGLEYFFERRSRQTHNYILLGVYILLQAYFIYLHPSLSIRNIIFSSVLLFFCLQIAWLVWARAAAEMRKITRNLGYISLLFALICILRILVELLLPAGSKFFQANVYETTLYISYQMLYVVLTFSLFMVVNQRLFIDLEQDISERKKTELALHLSQEKFSKAFQSSPNSIIISRLRDGQIVDVNNSFIKITGFPREEALHNSTLALNFWVNPEKREEAVAILQRDGQIRDYEFEVRIKSGKILKAEFSGEVIKIGGEDFILSVIRDISEQKRIESILHLRLELWEFSMAHSVVEVMQKALDEIEGLTTSQVAFFHLMDPKINMPSIQVWSTRTKDEFCQLVTDNDHQTINNAGLWAECVRQKKTVIHNDFASLLDRKSMPMGHTILTRELVAPLVQEDRVVSVLGIGNKSSDYDEQDIEVVEYIESLVWAIVSKKQADEKIVQLNNQLEALAMTDDLTALPNRRFFFIRGGEEINRARRYQDPLALIMIDIDNFKRINDTYGHDIGDLVLQSIARLIRKQIREVDLPARLGGEEFGILMPNTGLAEAAVVAERLRKEIEEQSCLLQGKTITLTASLGLATLTPEMKNLDNLFHFADTAMYQAKNEGRNRVVLFR
jgi:diguanylate cyclase (GGDEF)-like protein/PAS domain S-box-containing protein